jgi:hypothetical protein
MLLNVQKEWKMSQPGKMKVLALCALLLLASCAHTGLRIANNVTLCCPGNYPNYEDYALRVDPNMPLFLSSWVVDMFDSAFQELGMQRDDQINDLIVTLSYRHVNLDAEQQDINPFVAQSPVGPRDVNQEGMTIELRYIAVIEISMRETATGEEVWAGEVSRIHTVAPGEYMHEGNSRAAFLETFRDILRNYPARD